MENFVEMTNEQLLIEYRQCVKVIANPTDYHPDVLEEKLRKQSFFEAELLNRLNAPKFRPCTECKWEEKDLYPRCMNKQSFLWETLINETTSCKLWEEKGVK